MTGNLYFTYKSFKTNGIYTADSYDEVTNKLVKTVKAVADITKQDGCEEFRGDSRDTIATNVELSLLIEHSSVRDTLERVVTAISIKRIKPQVINI